MSDENCVECGGTGWITVQYDVDDFQEQHCECWEQAEMDDDS